MKLPLPKIPGRMSVEEAIKSRRTLRDFRAASLILGDLAQLLWAAQGITAHNGFKRAAPSAGALYPMDVYTIVGEEGVEELQPGLYHYRPRDHGILRIAHDDLRKELARASLSQMWMAQAPINLLITAEYDRVTVKYGNRGVRYAMIEAGHIAQNIFLQAEALGLGAGIVGAFEDQAVIKALGIPSSHEPLLIMPVGHPR